MKKKLFLVSCLLLNSQFLYAEASVNINVIGTVLKDMCELSNIDDNIDFGTIEKRDISNNVIIEQDFTLKMIKCDGQGKIKFEFLGTEDPHKAGTLAVKHQVEQGSAGYAIYLEDKEGKQIKLEDPIDKFRTESYIAGSNDYTYTAKIVPNGQSIKSGTFNSILYVKITYP